MNQTRNKAIIEEDGIEVVAARGHYYVRDAITKQVMAVTHDGDEAIKTLLQFCEEQERRAFYF
jgi:hypothetical protein